MAARPIHRGPFRPHLGQFEHSRAAQDPAPVPGDKVPPVPLLHRGNRSGTSAGTSRKIWEPAGTGREPVREPVEKFRNRSEPVIGHLMNHIFAPLFPSTQSSLSASRRFSNAFATSSSRPLTPFWIAFVELRGFLVTYSRTLCCSGSSAACSALTVS